MVAIVANSAFEIYTPHYTGRSTAAKSILACRPARDVEVYLDQLDLGHFAAGGYDAIAFIEKYHGRITNLHLNERKTNQGSGVPWA